MRTQHTRPFSRRRFLRGVTLAGTAGLLGVHHRLVAAEPPPETTRVRLTRKPSICEDAEYVAEDLLQGEGFTGVRYVKKENFVDSQKALASGEVDFTMFFSPPFLLQLEAGDPLVLLAGVHVGCFELFGSERVRSIRDLKGKTAAVTGLGGPEHVFLASMAAYVGLDPRKDIRWVVHPQAEAARLLAEGTIDAFLAFPPLAHDAQ